MGILVAKRVAEVSPKTSLDDFTSGSIFSGILKSSRSSLSHARVLMLYNKVREALLTSVTWVFPPVRFQMSQESIVPKAN
jgi:hypothetical protein